MIEELIKNIDTEIDILREISTYNQRIENTNSSERRLLFEVNESLVNRMRIVNSAIPNILKNISVAKKLNEKEINTNLEKINIKINGGEKSVVLNKGDKEKFLNELSISEKYISNLRHIVKKEVEDTAGFQKSRGYIKFANKIFFNYVRKMTKDGGFKDLNRFLRKANIEILLESYISLIFLTTLIASVFSIIGGAVFFYMYTGAITQRIIISLAIIFLIPVATYFILYFYPSTEKDSLEGKIDQELPFAVIHMSAISGSGIEPSSIFKIIGLSKEYPNLAKEIRKILNQINIYGYDLVTALNNVSRNTPSAKLAELLLGLSTNISSGGALQTFFEKRAETLLLTYRLEREKFTKTAETFMDIYITVVIAAPMILLLIFILLSVGDFNIGISPQLGTVVLILLVGLVNLVFLGIIHLKQPAY
ncbi:MAG: type II secretion system F family protein [Nanoarchaeota archaeon]|nr:type II secretion system F family protein [Nanoarchaeota archaeon]